MNNIFIGMLFIFLNFNLDFDYSRIGLIPTPLGYVFILLGLSQLAKYSQRFLKVKPYSVGMLIFSTIFYFMDLIGYFYTAGGFISYGLGIISTFISLYISLNIVMGIKDIETIMAQELNTGQLLSTWKVLAFISLLTYLLLFIPILALISIIAGLVAGVYYIVVFSKSKKLFYEQNADE